MLVIGLTGNYGMGKSTVLEMFRRLGAVTVSADGIVSRLLSDAPVLERIRGVLGGSVFSEDGSIDRAKVSAVIFSDREKRDAVEAVLHPLVIEKIEVMVERLGRNETEGKVVIVEIPLLFEKGYSGRFHRTITVYADEETAFRRLSGMGVSREDARARLNAQMPVHEKIRMAAFTINNNGTPEETEKQVKAVYARLMDEVRDGYHKRA